MIVVLTSSAVQKLASAFLYICQMSPYWIGRMTKRLGFSISKGSWVFSTSVFCLTSVLDFFTVLPTFSLSSKLNLLVTFSMLVRTIFDKGEDLKVILVTVRGSEGN